MKYYSAGNFVLMSKIENEQRFRKKHKEVFGYDYNRLTSFFFKKESDVILNVKKEEE